MSITGNVKNLASTLLGAALFPGFEATARNVGGLAIAYVGAGLYSYISLQKGMRAAAGAAAAAAAAAARADEPKAVAVLMGGGAEPPAGGARG